MSDEYTYPIASFKNNKVDAGRLTMEITASSISISIDHIDVNSTNCKITFKGSLPSNDKTTLDGLVADHTGEEYQDEAAPVDPTNKPRVQATPRPLGHDTIFLGCGDDPSDVTDIGGGERLIYEHKVGESLKVEKYIDLNIIENTTWMLEGQIHYENAIFDYVDFEIMCRAMGVAPASNTQFTALPNGIIIPAQGDGNVSLTGDWALPNGGLVFMPDDDQKNPPQAFWNADWNSTTKKFENHTPAPQGDGRYNMFAGEGVLKRFIKGYNMLGTTMEGVDIRSYDSAQLGHGMRIRMTLHTHGEDHAWKFCANMTMFRKSTV